MARLGSLNIDTSGMSAFTDLLKLAMQIGQQAKDREWRSEEAEKNREFQESSLYLQDMLNKEGRVIDSIYAAEDEAATFGYNIEEPINKLHKFNEADSTSNSSNLMQLTKDIKDQRMNDLLKIRSDIAKEKKLFNQGRQIADIIDTSRDGRLDEAEINAFELIEKARTGNPDYLLSDAMVKGANYSLADPKARLSRLQLKGEEYRQEEFELDSEMRGYDREIKKLEYKDLKDRVGKDLADRYKKDGTLSIGTPSWQDLATGNAVKSEWAMMRPDFLHAMVLNTPTEYTDPNPGEIDMQDIRYAITPAIRNYAKEQLNNPDFMDAVGITNQDVAGNTDKYKVAIEKITSNALAGVRENPAYTLKTQKDIYTAMLQEKETITKVFDASELSTYNNSVTTLASTLPLNAETGAPQEVVIDNIKINLKASGINWDEEKIISEYLKLRGPAEPYVLAQTIAGNPDSKTLLKAAGQDVFIPIMEKALKYVSSSAIAPLKRKPKKQKKKSKGQKSVYEEALDFDTGQYTADILQQYGTGAIGQVNLDARIREAAVLSIDIKRAREDGNVAEETKLSEQLALIEIQIQNLQSQGFQPGSGSLKDITLELIR